MGARAVDEREARGAVVRGRRGFRARGSKVRMRHGKIFVGHGCSVLSVSPWWVTNVRAAQKAIHQQAGASEYQIERHRVFAGDRL